MAIRIDGKALSDKILEQVSAKVRRYSRHNMEIGLAVVLVGNDPASMTYVRSKIRDCKRCGIKSFDYVLPEEASQNEVLSLIRMLNQNSAVTGILVQMPLPEHIDENAIVSAISPDKDVDGFHPENMGRLTRGVSHSLAPCTPLGVMRMLDEYGIDPAGKNAVVIGRSTIVGKPMALMLLERDATVTIAHSHTDEVALKSMCRDADILVVACGKPRMIDASWVKEGAAVIDVGINRDENGRLCGDVDYDSVSKIAGAITPVPGGVGLMTRAMLMENVCNAAEMQYAKKIFR